MTSQIKEIMTKASEQRQRRPQTESVFPRLPSVLRSRVPKVPKGYFSSGQTLTCFRHRWPYKRLRGTNLIECHENFLT